MVFDNANRALGVIFSKSKAVGGLPFSVFTQLYNASVLAISNYSAHVWAHRKNNQLSKVQNSALKFFFGVGAATPLAALEDDSGWPPMQLQLQYTMLKYWFRVCSMSESRLPRQAFLWSCQLADSGKQSWAFHVRNLIDGLNISEISPLSLDTGTPTSVHRILWEALACKYMDTWMHNIHKVEASASENGGKLAMYRTFKLSPNVEPYIRANLPVRTRRVVAGLRAGCLLLQVELGRYTSPKTPIEDRICKLCNNGVEDQEHFLLHCSGLRETFSFNPLHQSQLPFAPPFYEMQVPTATSGTYTLYHFWYIHLYVCRQIQHSQLIMCAFVCITCPLLSR